MRRLTLALLICASVGTAAAADTASELIAKARAALAARKFEEAVAFADRAVAADPKSAAAYLVRGTANGALEKHSPAAADFGKVIELEPDNANAYQVRGSEHFKLGHIAESIADFDKYLELRPAEVPHHWQRGIAYYYAGRYEDGRKQFEVHQTVNPADVENAVWRYLCMARTVGADKARADLLKIGEDRRVPMKEVYALFAGKAKPEDVLAAARAGKPSAKDLNARLFYAHLYLGLYYEAVDDGAKALDHLRRAAKDHKTPGYMWDVARVHVELLERKAKPKG